MRPKLTFKPLYISIWILLRVLYLPHGAAHPFGRRENAVNRSPHRSVTSAALFKRSLQPRELSNGAVGGIFVGSVLGFVFFVLLLIACQSMRSEYPSPGTADVTSDPPLYSPPRSRPQHRWQPADELEDNPTRRGRGTAEPRPEETRSKRSMVLPKFLPTHSRLVEDPVTGKWQFAKLKPKDPSKIPRIRPLD